MQKYQMYVDGNYVDSASGSASAAATHASARQWRSLGW